MSHRKLSPLASAAAMVLLVAACTSSPTATPRPTQTSVQATAAVTTQATTAPTEEAAATVEAAATEEVPAATVEATEVAAATSEATTEVAAATVEAPVGTTVALATVEATAEATVAATVEATTEVIATVEATVAATTEVIATAEATVAATAEATLEPTTVAMATIEPTVATAEPTIATVEPTVATVEPTVATVEPTVAATVEATIAATVEATAEATVAATVEATAEATVAPTDVVVATVEPTAEVPTGPQTFADSDPSDGGITFVYPEGVTLAGSDNGQILTVDGGVINVYPPATYAQVIGGQTFTSDVDALTFFVKRVGLAPAEVATPVATAEATAAATVEAAPTVELVVPTEEVELVKGELARADAELLRRDQAGTAYLLDVGGGEKAVVVWMTAVGTEPSPALVEAFTSVVDTLTFTPAPPPPTEEAPVVEPTVEATAAATAEATAAATTEATAEAAVATVEAPAATAEATTAAEAPASVVDVAMGNSDFSTLVNAVVAADLVETLSDTSTSYTVFAPTNEAFEAALKDMGMTADELLADKTKLAEILKYHIIPGSVLAADLKAGDVETLQGESVTIAIKGDTVTVNDATVVTADVASGNGIVHVIDKVLVPPSLKK